MSDNAPGWLPDPTGRFEHRYWDGTQWTDHVSDAGVASTDGYAPDAAGGADATPEGGAPEAPRWDEPTVAQPAAPSDATATWPATPVPPAPPAFTPPGPMAGAPEGGSSGSKKRLLIGGGILAAIAIAVILLLSMGKDDSSDVRAELAAKIREQDDSISARQAECVADLLVDEGGEDTFRDVDYEAEEPPEEFLQAFIDVGPERLVEECGIEESTFGGSTETTESTDTTDDGGLDTSGGDMPPGFEDQLADAYETSMGLPREKAECLAGKIADAIESGELNQEEAMSEIFGYLSDCDIDMSELSGN